jgi:glucose dehydrogenase
MNKMGGAGSTYGNRRSCYRVLVGKPAEKEPLGICMRRWENNIRMDLQDVGWGAMERVDLAEDRESWRAFVNVVMRFAFHKMRGIS